MAEQMMEKEWQDFKKSVLVVQEEPTARLLRAVFFAGAIALWSAVVAKGEDGEPAEVDVEALELVEQEFREFYEQQRATMAAVETSR